MINKTVSQRKAIINKLFLEKYGFYPDDITDEIEKSYIDNYNTFSNLLNKYTNVILFSNMQSNKLINEKRIYANICKSIQVMLMNSLKNITNLFEIEQFDSNLLNKKHVIYK